MFVANIVPGQGFQKFTIYKFKGGLTETGRPKSGYEKTKDEFFGMLMNAKEKEIEQAKQNGHPVTHKIVQYGASVKAEAMDYLVLPDGRQFYVQGTKNPSDMDLFMTYLVEERKDLKLTEVKPYEC